MEMPEENVEIVRRVYDALNRRDWVEVFRHLPADFQLITQRGPSAGTKQGRDRAKEFIEDYTAAFDKVTWQIEKMFEDGDRVVVLVKVHSRPSGASVDLVVRNGHLWAIRDGVLVAMESFPEPERALEAAGLSE